MTQARTTFFEQPVILVSTESTNVRKDTDESLAYYVCKDNSFCLSAAAPCTLMKMATWPMSFMKRQL